MRTDGVNRWIVDPMNPGLLYWTMFSMILVVSAPGIVFLLNGSSLELFHEGSIDENFCEVSSISAIIDSCCFESVR